VAAFRTRRACAVGAVSAALRAALSMRGAVMTPFHFLRRQFPFITFPGREFPIGISGYTTTASDGIAVDVTLEAGTWRSAFIAESQSPTVANHPVFEADARVVRGGAQRILANPALPPTVNRAG